MRRKFFINMQSREITEEKHGHHNYLIIYANNEEVEGLRAIMDNLNDADNASFIRAGIPFIPYHKDDATDTYDQQYIEAIEFIYEHGDEKTKEHIKEMGILSNK